MKSRQIPLILTAAAVALFHAGATCPALSAHGTAAGGTTWQILVQDFTGSDLNAYIKGGASSQSAPYMNDPKTHQSYWRTYWCDNSKSKTYPGFVVSSNTDLYSLTDKQQKGVTEGVAWSIDKLISTQLTGGKSSETLTGTTQLENAMKYAHSHAKQKTAEPFNTVIKPVACYNNVVCFMQSEEHAPGNPDPKAAQDCGSWWGLFEVAPPTVLEVTGKLVPENMQTMLLRMAVYQSEHKIAATGSQPAATSAAAPGVKASSLRTLGISLCPQGGGALAQLGTKRGGTSGCSTIDTIWSVKAPGQMTFDLSDLKQPEFQKSHAALLPYDKLSFWRFAPDGKAVVFAQAGTLYWMSVPGKSRRAIGKVSNLRGFQWFAHFAHTD